MIGASISIGGNLQMCIKCGELVTPPRFLCDFCRSMQNPNDYYTYRVDRTDEILSAIKSLEQLLTKREE